MDWRIIEMLAVFLTFCLIRYTNAVNFDCKLNPGKDYCKCVFPFTAKGVTYRDRCAWSRSYVSYWCAFTSTYSTEKGWAKCPVRCNKVACFDMRPNGKTYKRWPGRRHVSKPYFDCKNSTKSSKSSLQHEPEYCKCVFPFSYKGLIYRGSCAWSWWYGYYWCAFSSTYSPEKGWAKCPSRCVYDVWEGDDCVYMFPDRKYYEQPYYGLTDEVY